MIALIMLSMVLAGLLLISVAKNLAYKKNMRYLTSRIKDLSHSDAKQTIQILSDDRDFKEVLKAINDLVNVHYDVRNDHQVLQKQTKQLVSNISHDLRTPLTVIMGYIETELLKDLNAGSRANLEKVYQKSSELLTLINQFFDLSKLSSGDMTLHLDQYDISELVRQQLASMYPVIIKADVQVHTQIPEDKLMVTIDKDLFIRALSNLIDNALAYGSDGHYLGIEVWYDDWYVHVSVTDKGKGIPSEDQSRIFERMYTLEHSRNKSYQGSGLGLSISKEIVDLLGGWIDLESQAFNKTRFTMHIKRS